MQSQPSTSDPAMELAAARAEIANLQSQLQAFTQILDAVPDMVLYKGPQSKIRWANRAFREYYGMSADQLQGMIDAPFSEPDNTQQYIIDDTHVFTSGEVLDIPEEPVTRFDGEVTLFHTVKTPIRDHEGTVIGTVGLSRNISAERAMADELISSRKRAQRIIANVPGMVYQFLMKPDGSMSFLFVSKGSREIYNLEPEQIVENPALVLENIHPDDQREFQESIAISARDLTPWKWEGRIITYRGQGWLQGSSKPERLPDGSTLWDGVVLDITQQKQAEEQQKRFANILGATPDFVAIAGELGKALYINPAGRAMIGLAPDADLEGMNLLEAHPQWAAKLIIEEGIPAVEKEGIWQAETALRGANGQDIPVSQVIVRHPDSAGKTLFLSTIARDIRQEKRDQQERQRLQEEVIRVQAQTLAELSTPLIALNDHTLLMPLIGSIDSMRANQVIEALLEGVTEHQARVVLLDLTGVPVVDTQVATVLLQAARAVRLLGAEVVITGIRPEIAQTLVGLGVDLSSIVTRGNLQTGISYAMEVDQGRHR